MGLILTDTIPRAPPFFRCERLVDDTPFLHGFFKAASFLASFFQAVSFSR